MKINKQSYGEPLRTLLVNNYFLNSAHPNNAKKSIMHKPQINTKSVVDTNVKYNPT